MISKEKTKEVENKNTDIKSKDKDIANLKNEMWDKDNHIAERGLMINQIEAALIAS